MTSAPVAENPFARDVEERLPGATRLVIFGATGDLAARKLLPAIYNLALAGHLPERFKLVGLGRGADRETFHENIRKAIAEHSRTGLDEGAFETLKQDLDYVVGDFTDPQLFDQLAEHCAGEERPLFYLATAPRFFGEIAAGLARVGLGRGSRARLIVEKPFGRDLDSARELNAALDEAFDEQQIFRIDHYLGKETVQNLLVWRFANGIFEPIWNRRYVDHVQITVAEDIGIGHRAGYYDRAGALRDIVQNHALQLVALMAMEPPVRFEAELIRDEKVKLLRSLRPEHVEDAVFGQYRGGWVGGEQVPGYRQEEGIAEDSRTDTYVALRLEVDNWRWGGTPFYVRTGKRLPRQATEIAVRFKPVPHLAFQALEDEIEPNELVLSIQPNEGATLRTIAKVPGTAMELRPVQMDFQYGSAFLSASPEAYERLLHDVMVGDPTLFTRADEVEAAWQLLDALVAAEGGAEPEPYDAGTPGPAAADELLARDGRVWREL